jgi:mannose-6-phosphate isomerase-like protein (cupin superfamily)
MVKKILIIAGSVIGVVILYVFAGIVIDRYIIPAEPIRHEAYFKPGDKLFSRFEGFDQTVLEVDGEWMRTRLEVLPHAGGPPEHFHEGFSEVFTVKSGTLSVLVNGEKKILRAGETLTVPPMTRHKPFNETDERVIVESTDPRSIPTKFGYVLSQLYGFMDTYPEGPNTLQMVLQLSVSGDDADSYLADGPSLGVQRAMRVVMAPTARLLGYRNHYPAFRPRTAGA